MDLNQGDAPQPESPKPESAIGLLWLLLGIVPIPVGLLIGPINIFNSAQGPNKSLFVRYAVATGILSLICGIGLCGGFRSRRMANIVVGVAGGIVLGAAITGLNLLAVFFMGCASAFSHI